MAKEERKEFAQQLSAIMNNPNTPTALYNAIADVMTFYSNFIDYNSPLVIEMSLDAYEQKGNNQTPDKSKQ